MVVFVAILSLIFFGMLVALSVITPSWRWVLLFIAALFACLAASWVLLWAGFQPTGMSIRAAKGYLSFITTVAVVGSALFGIATLWSNSR